MQKSDVELDLGLFDVQNLPATEDESTSSPGGQVAMRVQPNAKCSSCYHYLDHDVACAIGEQPMKCGTGDDVEHGYAPLVTNQAAALSMREKGSKAVNKISQAHAVVEGQEAPQVQIHIIGDTGFLALSAENDLRKAEHRPPHLWLRFMARQLEKSEYPQAVAADIWWQRLGRLPARFEKGLFQEVMTRLPTEAEVNRAVERATPSDIVSKSQWLKTCIRGEHIAKAGENASVHEKPVLRSGKAKSFHAMLQTRDTKKAIKFLSDGEKGQAQSEQHAKMHTKHLAARDASADALRTGTAAAHTHAAELHSRIGNHDAAAQHKDFAAKISKKKSDGGETKKSLSTWDYRDTGTQSAKLKNDELETYLQGFLEACAQEQFRDMKAKYENDWWRTNRAPMSAGGTGTWGDIEQAKESVKREPPMYAPDYEALAHYAWQKLMSKLPDNKNLLMAKRQLGLTQDGVKARIKNIEYGC